MKQTNVLPIFFPTLIFLSNNGKHVKGYINIYLYICIDILLYTVNNFYSIGLKI